MCPLESVLATNIVNIISLSLAFILIGLNVYLSSQVLNVTDLTCDASVALGGCAYGVMALCGIPPAVAFVISVCFGAGAGFLTSSLVNNMKIEPVLASIIILTVLQTVIVKILDFGKIAVAGKEGVSIFASFSAVDNALITLGIVSVLFLFFAKMINSEYGLAMRVYGDGQIISKSLGIDTKGTLSAGLEIGNAFAAAAGALVAQITGTFDAAMGGGAFVFGLASIIIGNRLLSPGTIKASVFGCLIGAVIYKVMTEVITLMLGGSEYNSMTIAVALIFLIAIIQDSKTRRIT
jgi:putative ABC transport system permease protein